MSLFQAQPAVDGLFHNRGYRPRGVGAEAFGNDLMVLVACRPRMMVMMDGAGFGS